MVLDILAALFEQAMDVNSKTFFVKLGFSFPEWDPCQIGNSEFSCFIERLMARLGARGLQMSDTYLWVQDLDESPRCKYHCVFFMNGNKTQSINRVATLASGLWNKALWMPFSYDGLVSRRLVGVDGRQHENGVMLRRDDPELRAKLSKCFASVAYMARIVADGGLPLRMMPFGHSPFRPLEVGEEY